MSTESNVNAGKASEKRRLAESDRHRLLASERRRAALDVLGDHRSPIDISDLAEEVVLLEGDTEPVDHVMITLHHHHLPLMADLGIITYDPSARVIYTHRMDIDFLTE